MKNAPYRIDYSPEAVDRARERDGPRCGQSTLRVYYEVREEPDPVVVVKAVGVKDRDRVRIGREEVEL